MIKVKTKYIIGLAFFYIYFPIIIFLLGNIKFYIFVLIMVGMAYGGYKLLTSIYDDLREDERVMELSVVGVVLSFILIIGMGFLCSWNGEMPQPLGDADKNNAIIHDLLERSWPVYYINGLEKSMLSSYIGQYMVPCIIGKLFNSFIVAENLVFIWNEIGIVLIFFSLCWVVKIKDAKKIIIMTVMLFLFSGALPLVNSIADLVYGNQIKDALSEHWLITDGFLLQYRSNYVAMRWVWQQYIVPWLVAAFFYQLKERIEHYVILLLPIAFFSMLAFLGILCVALIYAAVIIIRAEIKKEILKKIFSISNIVNAFGVGGIVFLYFYGNMLGTKPECISLHIIKYGKLWMCYIIFTFFMFGLHFILISREYKKDALFWGTFFVLLVLPLFTMGLYNDLNLGASIMPMFLLFIYILKYLFMNKSVNDASYQYRKGILTVLLLIGMICPLKEIKEVVAENLPGKQRADNWKTLEIFANRDDDTIGADFKYNYYSYDIEENIFYRFIARRKLK